MYFHKLSIEMKATNYQKITQFLKTEINCFYFFLQNIDYQLFIRLLNLQK